MSLLDLNLGELDSLKILPDNDEVLLIVARAEEVPNKRDPSRNNLALSFDVVGDPLVADIRVWLPIPNAAVREQNPKQYTKQAIRILSFLNAFDLDSSEVPLPEDMIGSEGYAILAEEEGLDGSPQNGIRRFLEKR
jgi:hypothetical protein